jgi:Glycosyltransferase family 87
MKRYLSENAVCISLMGAGVAAMAWLGLYGFAWNDYDTEVRPSVEALVHGHLLAFLRLAPAYGGSLILRAPFALMPGLWGGGELAVYRAVALPCLIAGGAVGVYLVAQMRSRGAPRLWRIVVMGVCVANPITLHALEVGHPEDVLGAALCVASVLLAERDRPLLAGLALGAAIANKEWALLAIGPVMLALSSRRVLCLLACGSLAAVVLAPLSLVGSGGFIANARGAAAPPSTIFQPWQVWWFLGHHGHVVKGLFGGIKPGYRVAPSWIGGLSHPLIIALGLPLTALLWRRKRGSGQALALLTLLMLLRCMLDSWDTTYYTLPFVLALLAWEVLAFEHPPVLALLASVSTWFIFQWLPLHVSADAQSALFLAFSLPALGAITAWLYTPNTYAALVVRSKTRSQSRPITVARGQI